MWSAWLRVFPQEHSSASTAATMRIYPPLVCIHFTAHSVVIPPLPSGTAQIWPEYSCNFAGGDSIYFITSTATLCHLRLTHAHLLPSGLSSNLVGRHWPESQ